MSLYETIKDYVKNAGVGLTLAAAGLASGCYNGNSELDIAFEQEKPGISTSLELEPGVLDPELEGEYVEPLEQRGLNQDLTEEEILNPLGVSESENEGYVKVGGGIDIEDGHSLRFASGISSDKYSFDVDYIGEEVDISSEFGNGNPTDGGTKGSKSLDSKFYSILVKGEYRFADGKSVGFMVNKSELDELKSEDGVDYRDITPPVIITDYIYDDWKTLIDYESFGGKILEPFIFSLIKSKKVHDLKYNGHVHTENSMFGSSDSYYESKQKEKIETLEAILGTEFKNIEGRGDGRIELFYSTIETDSTKEEVPDLTRIGVSFEKSTETANLRIDFIKNNQDGMPNEFENELGIYSMKFWDKIALGLNVGFETDEYNFGLPFMISLDGKITPEKKRAFSDWINQLSKYRMREGGLTQEQKDEFLFENFENMVNKTKSIIVLPNVGVDIEKNFWDVWGGISIKGNFVLGAYYMGSDLETRRKAGLSYTINDNTLVNLTYEKVSDEEADLEEKLIGLTCTFNF